MTDAASSYEELPYSRNPFHTTHPDLLATVALLHGLEAPSATRCRVLELGCASGGNLIPMAAGLPDSTFVGIDLSPRQITLGQELVAAVGLKNIELRTLSIMDVGDDFGAFDYVICHGVYSWVPAEVQDRILQICHDRLAPDGLAYVSYNTFPGWHLRGMVRDMLGYHVKQYKGTAERVRQARAFLDFLDKSVRAPDKLYGQAVRNETKMLADESDTYLFHEHLEDLNSPLYFHEFADRLAARKLQYVGEAQTWALTGDLPMHVQHILDTIAGNRVAREQYVDFLGGRLFRRSVLCHADRGVKAVPSAEAVQRLRATALVRPSKPEPDVVTTAAEEFRSNDGVNISTNNPTIKAALLALYRPWPRSLAFEELWTAVSQMLASSAPGREQLAQVVANLYHSHLLELGLAEPPFTLTVSAKPIASAVARVLSLSEERVPNLRHRSVELAGFDRLVLRYLDGSRDRAALVDALVQAVAEGVLEIQRDGPLPDKDQLAPALDEALGECLQRLAGSALLIG